MRTTSHLTQIEAVRAGFGVALLTHALARIVPDLIAIEIPKLQLPPVELWLVTPEALAKTARIRAVWDLFAEALKQLGSNRPMGG
jgi:DNA-binding transcriptional LysR family regulator